MVDHARAIDVVFHGGKMGETYNIGGFNEWQNINLIKLLIKITDEKLGRPAGTSEALIAYVKDRPGHDKRYAIDASKIKDELGWTPSVTFERGLDKTIDWYLTFFFLPNKNLKFFLFSLSFNFLLSLRIFWS